MALALLGLVRELEISYLVFKGWSAGLHITIVAKVGGSTIFFKLEISWAENYGRFIFGTGILFLCFHDFLDWISRKWVELILIFVFIYFRAARLWLVRTLFRCNSEHLPGIWFGFRCSQWLSYNFSTCCFLLLFSERLDLKISLNSLKET